MVLRILAKYFTKKGYLPLYSNLLVSLACVITIFFASMATADETINLSAGLNLFHYPVEVPQGLTAFGLLQTLGGQEAVSSIQRFNRTKGRFETASWLPDGPAGVDFEINNEEGYFIYMKKGLSNFTFPGSRNCVSINLKKGFNLVGFPCAPEGYTSTDILQDLTEGAIKEIKKYDPQNGIFKSAYWDNGTIAGDVFPIVHTEAYIVYMNERKGWPIPLAVSISADPTKGSFPMEVNFSSTVLGGLPPYSYAWDMDEDGIIDDTRASFSYVYRNPGIYTASLTVTDGRGSTASDAIDIYVLSAPTVKASASPLIGETPPLEVSFSCSANDADGSIVLYEWDFDGDGNYEWNSETTCNTAHTYTNKGAYDATLRVTDNDGLSATDSVDIFVGRLPTVTASADPMTGPAPLLVNFDGSASDSDGTITLYEWDFDGDGSFDWSSTSSPVTTYTYTYSGVYNATLRVTDNDGIINTDAVLISVAGAPIAEPRAYPLKGDIPLTVTFFCDGDDFDGSVVQFEWDFDGDGNFDWSQGYSTNATYTYTEPGTHQATLRVTDNQGLTGTSSITIEATMPNPLGYPTALPIVTPTNGPAPLQVHLIGQASDPNGNIEKYEWDFEGDGNYDWSEAVIPRTILGGPVIAVEDSSSPAFSDMDADGDYDLFIGAGDGAVYLYRNEGNNEAPSWIAAGMIKDAEGKVIDVGYHSRPILADIDSDGDYDLFIGEYEGEIHFYQNDGSNNSPQWKNAGILIDAEGNPVAVSYHSRPALVDIDSDSDLDLVIGEYYGQVYLYRNEGDINTPVWVSEGVLKDLWGNPLAVNMYSAPAFIDIDSDGDYDLFVGDSTGIIHFFKNEGDASFPIWDFKGELKDLSGETIDTAYYSRPIFVDIDADGDEDLFIGEGYGQLYFYRNIGDAQNPVWKLCSDRYNYIGTDYYSTPTPVDIDQDGDYDLFVGDEEGQIHFYQNNGNNRSPIWSPRGVLFDSQQNLIDIGNNSKAALADIDADGDYDLLIGSGSGDVYLYLNTGSSSAPSWSSSGRLTDDQGNIINVGNNSAPTLTDIDADGDYDLLIGTGSGDIYLYLNSGSSSAPSWSSSGRLTDDQGNIINVGSNSTPTLTDIDADGDYDLLIGTDAGEIYLYRNDGNATSATWDPQGVFYDSGGTPISVSGNSSPAPVDLDGDGDRDLLVGERYGQIYLYRTIGSVLHIYQYPGTYRATLRVTDNDGLTDTEAIDIVVGPGGAPSVRVSAEPTEGTGPLTVSFQAEATDPDGTIALYEWDFDADGTYDWSSTTTGNTDYTYTRTGLFYATLRVTDNEGTTISQAIAIKVNPGISASCSGAFNPHTDETGTITSTLTADATVTLKIIDRAGNVIRTLVNNEPRPAGTYNDTWDGRDDLGNLVRDGVYYFLMEFVVNGEVYTFDLREKAQYTESYPSVTHSSSFAPYKDIFYTVTYQLTKPSEVSMYFWTWPYDMGPLELVRTLFVREPKAAGSHTEIWDGTDDSGKPVSSDKPYAVAMQVWEMPDNAFIILGDKPEITDISADPNYFSPAYNPYSTMAPQQTVISFHLSEASSLECRIVNSDGVLVKTIMKDDLPAGTNSFIWDGKDQAGNLVKNDSYRIALTAIDAKGNRSTTRYALVVVYY